MNRRKFLKTSLVSPIYFKNLLAENTKSASPYFDILEVSGSYEQIGFRIGKHFSKNIQELIQRRAKWHTNLLNILASEKGGQVSEKLKKITQKHFPQQLKEIEGVAKGASLDFNHLWVIAIKSELGVLEKEPPGCSTIFYKDKKNMWLFHNEDGNAAYKDLMFVVKIKPPSGIAFISFVYPGTLMGNGPSMNEKGIIQTTNYISSTRTEIGLPRYVIGRAILESKSIEESVQIATMKPRSYPYHHNLVSIKDKKYLSVETVPNISTFKELKSIYYHTNHLILEKTGNYKYQDESYINSSSYSRYNVINDELTSSDLQEWKPDMFMNILSSHRNAPYSPCRHPKNDVKGQTLGTAFFDIEKGNFRLLQGNPCDSFKNKKYKDFKY